MGEMVNDNSLQRKEKKKSNKTTKQVDAGN